MWLMRICGLYGVLKVMYTKWFIILNPHKHCTKFANVLTGGVTSFHPSKVSDLCSRKSYVPWIKSGSKCLRQASNKQQTSSDIAMQL